MKTLAQNIFVILIAHIPNLNKLQVNIFKTVTHVVLTSKRIEEYIDKDEE